MPPLRSLNIKGRQKSCAECVKAKRRCDTGQPQCTRCTRQGLVCAYPGLYKQAPGPSDLTSAPLNMDIAISPLQEANLPVSTVDPVVLDFPTGLGEQPLDLDAPFNIIFDPFTTQSSGAFSNYEHHSIVSKPYNTTRPSSCSWAEIAPSVRARVGYVIEQFKCAPQMMVAANSTLWCHAMLYDEDMPRSMQDAYAACALYTTRNDVNTDFVIRHITARMTELVATSLPVSPLAIVARAHALMLYQIMLVFGGKVKMFSLAEATLQHLREAGDALLDLSSQQTDCFDSLPLYPSAAAHAAWRSFLFRETLRRTVLSLYQLIAICGMLLGCPNECAPRLALGNFVTISAELWQATSAFEFARAWNNKHYFLVHELDFTDFLTNGRLEDVDDFAKTMLVVLHGIDDIRGWLHERGGKL